MDAANVDLKAFTDEFYLKLCGGHLQPVLDILAYIHHETDCWLEITTLLIPGQQRLAPTKSTQLASWVREGTRPRRAAALLRLPPRLEDGRRAADAARHADAAPAASPSTPACTTSITGNVHDSEGDTTFCPGCQAALIDRDWYDIRRYDLDARRPLPALPDRHRRPLRQDARPRRPRLRAATDSGFTWAVDAQAMIFGRVMWLLMSQTPI